ncbi:hypothetical protein FE783_30215 [Paenibacillus mesophilus]|uniref:hypothetical protein n=1 Tax=Paenibacillus mesophilus TaxID=2582849 RepID=UPI00110DC0BD|nr:hypothetical protein [Paenibacillus mesophilus]TMV45134.1 hypothetical protein FE783_30215 [Paenibacillus mesophilus]
MKRLAADAYSTIPYLYIWGFQWIADSLLQYGWMLDPNGTIRSLLLWAAVGLSVAYWIRGRSGIKEAAQASSRANAASGNGGTRSDPGSASGTGRWIPAIAAAGLLLVVVLLARLELVPLFTAELFRSIVLSCVYVIAGMKLGREIVYLGLWLLALTVIIAVWYLGYAPIILGFSGGASLLACAVMFRIWAKAGVSGRVAVNRAK